MRLDTNGYYALGAPAYLCVIALELWALGRRGEKSYSLPESLANMSAGLGEVTLGVFIGPSLILLYDWAYAHLALIHWENGSIASWVFAFFLADFCYYAYHRASHKVAAFWAIHGVHHQAEELNVTVAIRHPWFSDAYSAPFYALCPIMGIPTAQFFVAISVISFYAFTVHSRTFNRPGLFLFVTPRTHIVHHAYNPRYIDKNFGAMFTLWDRMFGTHVEVIADDPPKLGTLTGVGTYDGARAQWVGFARLIRKARQAPSVLHALAVFVRPPAWQPPGTAPEPRIPLPPRHLSTPFALGLSVAFALVLCLAAHLFFNAAQMTWPLRAAEGALVFASLHVIGRVTDRSTSAPAQSRSGASPPTPPISAPSAPLPGASDHDLNLDPNP